MGNNTVSLVSCHVRSSPTRSCSAVWFPSGGPPGHVTHGLQCADRRAGGEEGEEGVGVLMVMGKHNKSEEESHHSEGVNMVARVSLLLF